MMTLSEKLEYYFDDILDAVQENNVLNKWKQQVDAMDIPPELVDMYMLKLSCQDWRETEFKTAEWKEKIYLITKRIITLQNRFENNE